MKIIKSKNIRIQVTCLVSIAIIFSVTLCYFLGWDFEINSFIVAIGILIVLLAALWLLCILLIKYEKEYYNVEQENITLCRKNVLLCKLEKSDIISMEYVRFRWALLMQWGGGYLNITCPIEALPDKKYASLIMPNGMAIFEISVSIKQAKEVAKILGRELVIK